MPELPEWIPLDRIGSVLSADDDGKVVGIVASEPAVEAGWAEHAALTLAKAWSEAGRRVMLVDASLHRPSLHTASGIDNGEGLSDATLFGASVGRVARQVDDGGYFLITAGTAVADTNAVVRSRRWDQIAKSSVEAGVTLGVFLRDGENGTAAFLGSAREIVVLSGRFDAPPASVRDLEGIVSLVTGPGVAAAPADEPPRPAEDSLSAAALQEAASQGKGRLVAIVVLAVILAVVLAVVFGLVVIPGLTPAGADAAPLGLLTGSVPVTG